jgi:RNA polymerase sigma-70 factor (ECF subfamily)
MDDASTDLELAAALASGEVGALARLYDRYGAAAYAVSVRILGDPGTAEDAVQDTFLKLWHGAARFDARRGSLRAWLLTAVRNRSIDYVRGRGAHQRREREIPLDAEARGEGSDPWLAVAAMVDRDVIRQALASLPAEQRQAVELAYFGGYSHREIAEMVRVPLGTVKGRMRLALEKLHSDMQGRGAARDG